MSRIARVRGVDEPRDEWRMRELDRRQTAVESETTGAAGPAFSAYQSVAQSIPNATFTAIVLNVARVDTHGVFTADTSRWVCPQDGVYLASGVGIVLGVGGGGKRVAALAANGVRVPGGTSIIPCSGVTDVTVPTPVKTLELLAGDYVEVWVFQDSGGALNTFASADTTSALDIAYMRAMAA